ncbi:MAG: hypothetical protein WD181_05860 [Solirubrobacterales bacterium]
MVMPVALFVAAAFAVFAWSQGQGGPVAGLIFFGIIAIGFTTNAVMPLVEKIKPYIPSRSKS